MPPLTVVFGDFLDTHNTDGMGVDWQRGRGEGKDYLVLINSHFRTQSKNEDGPNSFGVHLVKPFMFA